jgi:hypothetical protein
MNSYFDILLSHFGPYVLTRALLPLMSKTAQELDSDVRIVTVSIKFETLLESFSLRQASLITSVDLVDP